MMKRKGFTLVEVLAVIIILMVIIAISVPIISSIIKSSRMGAFSNSLKLIVNRAIVLETEDHNLDFYTIDETNIEELMGIDVTNYEALSFEKEADGDFFATIVGKNKFAGFVACGSEDITYVEEIGEEVYCYTPPVCNQEIIAETDESCFVFDEETNTITGYSSECPKSVGIPDQISGKDVIHIGDYAFESLNITSVSFPSTLRTIGRHGFYNNQLTNLNLPAGVESVGIRSFYGNVITCASLPKSLKTIGDMAFYNNQITNLVIPLNVESIGFQSFANSSIERLRINGGIILNEAFAYNYELKEIKFGPNVSNVSTRAFYGSDIINDLIIPGNIKTIGDYAFGFGCNESTGINIVINNGFVQAGYNSFLFPNAASTCKVNNLILESGSFHNLFGYSNGLTIKNVVIGENVGIIIGNPFLSYSNIENLTIYSGKIGDDENYGVFRGNPTKSLVLKEGVTSLGFGAFANSFVKTVTIPDSITEMGEQVFAFGELEEVIIGSGLKEIPYLGFQGNSINKLTLGSNVETIGYVSFDSNLIQKLSLPNSVRLVDGYSFNNNQISELNLNEGLETIGTNAFRYNQLDTVVIPSTVTAIGNDAFRNNPITSVTILGDENRFNGRWLAIGFPIETAPNFDINMCFDVSEGTINKYYIECGTVVDIPSVISGQTITKIASGAFITNQITALTIPETIVDIAAGAFSEPLQTITILGDSNRFNSNWKQIKFPVILHPNYEYEMCFDFSAEEITGYDKSCSKDVVIPSSIDGLLVRSVRGLGSLNLTSVSFPESLETIGDYSFYNNLITSIIIPNSVTEIGDSAFSYNLINNLVLPEGIYLNANAFSENLLTSINLPKDIFLGNSSFSHNLLTDITFPVSLTSISSGAFAHNQMTSLVFESYIGSIGSSAFRNNQITYLKFSGQSGLSLIGAYAFENNQFQSLKLLSWIDEIGNYAFANNEISSLILPSYSDKIGDYAFYNNKIKTLVLPLNGVICEDYSFANNEIENLIFPNAIDTYYYIKPHAFENNNIYNLTIPGYVSGIEDYAFANNQIRYLTFEENSSDYKDLDIYNYAFANNQIRNLSLPKHIDDIYNYAFANNQIQNLNFPTTSSLEYNELNIYQHAFQNNEISTLTIPSYINSINDYAFVDNNFSQITILGEKYRFNSNWTNIGFPINLMPNQYFECFTFANGYISDYEDSCTKDVVIPSEIDGETVIGIDSAAFDSKGLTSVIIPNTVVDIQTQAFRNNNLPDSQAFIYKRNPDGSIDNTYLVSYGGAKRNDIVIPNGVKVIDDYAFVASNLTGNLTLPASIEEIKSTVFGYNELTSVEFSNTLKKIGSNAFANNSLTSINLPNSLEIIQSAAFAGNKIFNITIPASVSYIDYGAFAGQQGQITSVTILGDPITRFNFMWQGIGFPDGLQPGYNYASEGCFELTNSMISWYDVDTCGLDVVIPDKVGGYDVLGIGVDAFYDLGITSVDFSNSNSIEIIEYDAFGYNNLTTVTLPSTLKIIDIWAFEYNQLVSITFPSGLENINDYAFCGNQLNNLTLPSTIKHMGEAAFNDNQLPDNQAFIYKRNLDGSVDNTELVSYGGAKRNDIVMPNQITTISEWAFYDNQITSITLSNNLTSIDEHAFYGNQITSITIPNSVTAIGSSAFSNNQITSITLSNNLINIMDWAFYSNQITSITIPESVTEIAGGAFKSNAITQVNVLGTPITRFNANWVNIGFPDGLQPIEIPEEEPCFGFANGKITSYNEVCGLEVIIPATINGEEVVEIGNSAFVSKGITSVDFSNVNIQIIGYNAFGGNNLTTVTLPSTLVYIDEHAFRDNQITSVNIPPSVVFIGNVAFYNNQITSVDLPDSVIYLGDWVFAANQITSLSISENLQSIPSYAFHSNLLATITIPAGVSNINDTAFTNNLFTEVNILGTPITRFNWSWTRIGFPAELMP